MNKTLSIVAPLLAACCVAAPAHASTYTALTLPELNANIRTWASGSDYVPLFPGVQTFNGVPFTLAVDGSGNTVFNAGTFEIAANVAGATTVYTLINSAWGSYGATVGSLEFYGSGGAYARVDLVEGTNVRDHYNGGYNNIIDPQYAQLAFQGAGGARLDEQTFTLPAAFATDTLTKIVFTNSGGNPQGSPFIAAATVAAVPEPASWALMLLGGFGLSVWARRRRATAR